MNISKLKKGDELLEGILEFVNSNEIKSGIVHGLGALSSAELMVYNLETKAYLEKKLEGCLEVGSFTAVIATGVDGKTMLHPHIVLCDENFTTYCGHVKSGTVAATFEFSVETSDNNLERYADSEIGLNLLR